MPVQRFLPDVERTRRGAGWGLMVIGACALAALAWAAIGAGRATITTLVLLALAATLAAWGIHLAFRRKVVVEVDVGQRTYAVIRNGTRGGSSPLDALGPLVVSKRTRLAAGGERRRSVVEYVVNPGAHSKIDLFILDTPGKARQKMEALARAWRLPCQSYGGDVRAAGALDVPLHERLRKDSAAQVPTPLPSEWGLRIEPLSPGYAIVSTHRSGAPLTPGILILLPIVILLAGSARLDLVSFLREAAGDVLERILAGLLGVVLLAALWKVGQGLRDTFFPGSVRVTGRGVSYRGSSLAFGEIEEVTATVPIEIIGDRRILRLANSFCPPAATTAVAHELQRLIVEVAPRASLPA